MNLHGARCTHLLALRHLFACFAALMHSLRRAHSLASFIVEWMLKMNYTFFYKNSLFSQSLDKRVSPSVRPSVTPTHFRRFRHASEHHVAGIGSCFFSEWGKKCLWRDTVGKTTDFFMLPFSLLLIRIFFLLEGKVEKQTCLDDVLLALSEQRLHIG